MTDDDFIPYDMPCEKRRRALRVHINKKMKGHDRYKGLPFEYIPIRYGCWRHMPGEKDWYLGRRKAPTDTGFGTAYEDYPRDKLFK